MARKKIKKFSVVELPEAIGSISDTLNVVDKVKNAPSINLTQRLVGIPTDGVIEIEVPDDEELVVPDGYELVGEIDYSTSEVRTGSYWIDGKPIYRKVIQASDLIAGIGNQIPTGIENLDIVVDINGTVNNSEYFQGTSKAHLKSFDFQIGTCYNKSINCVEIDVGANLSGYSANIILEYTKTTD